jgi:hypothetical protein
VSSVIKAAYHCSYIRVHHHCIVHSMHKIMVNSHTDFWSNSLFCCSRKLGPHSYNGCTILYKEYNQLAARLLAQSLSGSLQPPAAEWFVK